VGVPFDSREPRRNARFVANIELQEHRSERFDRCRIGQLAGIERATARNRGDDFGHFADGGWVIATDENIGINRLFNVAEFRSGEMVECGNHPATRDCSLDVSGNTSARRNERLELFVHPNESIRHRNENLSRKVLLILLCCASRRIPRRGEHDKITAGRSGVVSEGEQVSQVRPFLDELITCFHRPILGSRPDNYGISDARQACREAAAGRSSTTENSNAHPDSVTHRPR
jgi:hypothetical protein